jgi:hypothetical protein
VTNGRTDVAALLGGLLRPRDLDAIAELEALREERDRPD